MEEYEYNIDSNLNTIKNKAGIDFAFDTGFASDLYKVHLIELEDLVPQLFGTKLTIRVVNRQEPMVFKLSTNDDRDPTIFFGRKTFPIFRLSLYGEYHGEEAIIELFRQTVLKEKEC